MALVMKRVAFLQDPIQTWLKAKAGPHFEAPLVVAEVFRRFSQPLVLVTLRGLALKLKG